MLVLPGHRLSGRSVIPDSVLCLLVLASLTTAITETTESDGHVASSDESRWLGSQRPLQEKSQHKKQVAIVGARASGSSAAYHLSLFASEAGIPVDITVLEKNDYIGGRSTTVCAFENDTRIVPPLLPFEEACVPIELGASIFVSVNHILADAVAAFNLSTSTLSSRRNEDADETETLGIWDGQHFVFTQTSNTGKLQYWWNTVKILWKYGLAPIRTMKLMQTTIPKFLQMYEAPVFPWKDGLTGAVAAVRLLNTTAALGSQFVRQNGIAEAFARDIIQASTRVNYAQNLTSIHGLEAMVCMATDGAMSVEGGNWQIFASMLNASGVDVYLNSKVDEIEIGEEHDIFRISSNDAKINDYGLDALIIAAPYHQTGIKFTPTPSHVPGNIEYVKLHVTLFSSPHKLSPAAFYLADDAKVPDTVLTTCSLNTSHGVADDLFNISLLSISTLRTVMNYRVYPERKEYIYKIFSLRPVTASTLQELLGLPSTPMPAPIHEEPRDDVLSFNDVSWLYRRVWLSYPYLPPRVTFEPQQLHANLWYTSGIESFISTMETSALAGKNVARLIVDGWEGKREMQIEEEDGASQ